MLSIQGQWPNSALSSPIHICLWHYLLHLFFLFHPLCLLIHFPTFISPLLILFLCLYGSSVRFFVNCHTLSIRLHSSPNCSWIFSNFHSFASSIAISYLLIHVPILLWLVLCWNFVMPAIISRLSNRISFDCDPSLWFKDHCSVQYLAHNIFWPSTQNLQEVQHAKFRTTKTNA